MRLIRVAKYKFYIWKNSINFCLQPFSEMHPLFVQICILHPCQRLNLQQHCSSFYLILDEAASAIPSHYPDIFNGRSYTMQILPSEISQSYLPLSVLFGYCGLRGRGATLIYEMRNWRSQGHDQHVPSQNQCAHCHCRAPAPSGSQDVRWHSSQEQGMAIWWWHTMEFVVENKLRLAQEILQCLDLSWSKN